jgi:hypothetical protein
MSVAAELEAGGALTFAGTEEVRQRASEVPEPAMDEEDASSPPPLYRIRRRSGSRDGCELPPPATDGGASFLPSSLSGTWRAPFLL